MNPGDRPRSGLAKVLAVLATAGVTATLAVVADTDPAGAGELERFASCEALAEWGAPEEVATPEMGYSEPDAAVTNDAGAAPSAGPGAGDDASQSGSPDGSTGGALATNPGDGTEAPAASPGDEDGSVRTSAAAEEGGDGTNVIVEGVDELDIIDLLDAGHALVSAASRLSIIDLVDDRIVANVEIPIGSQITYDRANSLAWVVGSDPTDGRLTVTRVAVEETTLSAGESWSTGGWLVDARRIGDRLYLVASDGYGYAGGGTSIPFASGPVPCDQVLHPVGESDPSATLIVELPATGALEPVHATEVVGSGSSIHVTTDAAYLATPLYEGTTRTSFHRFDLATLEHTGSGVADGSLLNEFAMSDHNGFLRVALTQDGGMRGMPIEPMPAIDVIADGGATSSGGTEAPIASSPEPAPSLNEIVVFDTDGDLDVVGRTPRFGHPGETLQGIRFVGDTAYAVTFLQTDPFYVVDLADPTKPAVAGEVELPGFSSYLHPISAGLVAGFGPDAEGHIAVKLFDVSDPSRPAVVDELDLGDESPVAWDHHAFVDLGNGRFAVPASSYRELRPADCTPERQRALAAEEQRLSQQADQLYTQAGPSGPDPARIAPIEAQRERIYSEGCLYPTAVPESSVVIVDASGGQLQLVQRLGAVRTTSSAERVVATDDGWALLGGNRWVVIDGAGDQVADLELGPADVAYPVDGVAVRPGFVEG